MKIRKNILEEVKAFFFKYYAPDNICPRKVLQRCFTSQGRPSRIGRIQKVIRIWKP